MICERDIQLAIYADKFNGCQIMAPNYTPNHWWECDVWAVTRSHYAVEYEIKLSLSDFRADAKKKSGWATRAYDRDTFKHDRLSQGCVNGPSRFFYCIPKELEDLIRPHLPRWAGLMLFRPVDDWRHCIATEVVSAVRLHKTKVEEKDIALCGKQLANRYWPMLEKHQMERKKVTA